MKLLNLKQKEVVTELYLLHFETLDFFMKKFSCLIKLKNHTTSQ